MSTLQHIIRNIFLTSIFLTAFVSHAKTDDNIIISNAQETYTIIATKDGLNIDKVKSKIETTYTAQRVDEKIVAGLSYNNFSSIDKASAPGAKPLYIPDYEEGIFYDDTRLDETKRIISKSYSRLMRNDNYSHSKLIAEMEFGVWKYMYSPLQFRLTKQCLLKVFPNKPKSSSFIQYNNSYIYNELDKVNSLRNRIAHHEPVCFRHKNPIVDTSYILNEYQKIQTLFSWMEIDARSMLYGLDHVHNVCARINSLL